MPTSSIRTAKVAQFDQVVTVIHSDLCMIEDVEHEEIVDLAWGDVTGESLDPELVKRARQEEIGY